MNREIWDIILSVGGFVIISLLTVIGYLLKYGIDKIINEIDKIWKWITADTEKTSQFHAEILTINARCAERHAIRPGGRRASDPPLRPLSDADEP
jgi:hypothetical protein